MRLPARRPRASAPRSPASTCRRRSLSARADTLQTLPAEWLEKEIEALKPLVADADLIILGALVPGEIAPVLITEEMVKSMKPGSIIVDVSVDQGGNCACTQAGEEIFVDGVLVSAVANIPGSMPVVASWLYGKNMLQYVKNLFKNGPDAAPDWDDDIVTERARDA